MLDPCIFRRRHDHAFDQACGLQRWHYPAYRGAAYMQCTSQLFPLRINQMRHWIHATFQELVYLVREVEWHRWRTASGVTCSAMFLHLQVPRGSEPIGGVEFFTTQLHFTSGCACTAGKLDDNSTRLVRKRHRHIVDAHHSWLAGCQ